MRKARKNLVSKNERCLKAGYATEEAHRMSFINLALQKKCGDACGARTEASEISGPEERGVSNDGGS